MLRNLIFLIVMWSISVFLANRLYVIIKYRSINVKGTTYSKADTPVMYWLEMLIIAFGLVFVGGIAIITTFGIAGFIR